MSDPLRPLALTIIAECPGPFSVLDPLVGPLLAAAGPRGEVVVATDADPPPSDVLRPLIGPCRPVRIDRGADGRWRGGHARNVAAVHARGKWLAFVDLARRPPMDLAAAATGRGPSARLGAVLLVRADAFHAARGFDEALTDTREAEAGLVDRLAGASAAAVNPNGYGFRRPTGRGEPTMTILTTMTDGFDRVFALLERWVSGQVTADRLRHIVVTDAAKPPAVRMGQRVIRRWRQPEDPAHTIVPNLLAGMEHVETDRLAIMEADDLYAEDHLAIAGGLLDHYPVVGQVDHRVYHVPGRSYFWHDHDWHAILAETAVRREAYPALIEAAARRPESPGIDVRFWRKWTAERRDYMLYRRAGQHCTSLNLKGLVGGRAGEHHHYHRADWGDYKPDEDLSVLRRWIGRAAADLYAQAWPAQTPAASATRG